MEYNARFNPEDYECLAGVCPDLSNEDHCENCSLKRLKNKTKDMKTVEEYLPEESDLAFEGGIELFLKSKVVALIEQAQKEAYNQALEDAVEKAELEFNNFGMGMEYWSVDKDSILRLKK